MGDERVRSGTVLTTGLLVDVEGSILDPGLWDTGTVTNPIDVDTWHGHPSLSGWTINDPITTETAQEITYERRVLHLFLDIHE